MTFNNAVKRIGFCCKYLDADQTQKPKVLKEIQQQYTEKGTTVAWCNRQEKAVAEQKLLDIVEHNMQSAFNLVDYAGSLPEARRMVRLGSNQIPMATEPSWRYVFEDKTVRKELERGFRRVGDHARKHDVRISFHPGQFCVLASDNDDVVERSIDEFEYHADMARWMGYGQQFMDMKLNVHISGRKGYQGIIDVLPRLSPEARNTIAIENDEMCHGLDASLMLKDHVALVLDIHHHWIRDEEYKQADDDRVKMVIDSWRGVRPTIHYSVSREDLLPLHNKTHRPDFQTLTEQGYKKAKLRAHSDMMWNDAVNDWALSFLDYADIMVESKFKNLASIDLHKYYKGTNNELLENNVRQQEQRQFDSAYVW